MQDLTVDLVRLDGQWQIDSIQKGSPLTPDGAVWLFYNEYLARLVQSGAPLADKAYRSSPYLSPAFTHRLEAMSLGARDPFTLSDLTLKFINT